MTTSLIISTYNWPRALEFCLESVMWQRIMPTQIIVADDGSGPETRQVVERFERLSPVPLLHVWHPDDGFRLASIRNKAIAASTCDYVIQIDGDVILERHFVADHMAFARRGYYVGGSRAFLSEELSNRLLKGEATSLSPFRRGVQHWNNALRAPFLSLLLASIDPLRGRGCNMAYWRDDALTVNGYNEAMTGWGHEDNELTCRLRNIGREKRTLKFGGILYHLHHKLASRSSLNRNTTIFEATRQTRAACCEQGVAQHLGQEPSLYPAGSLE